MPAAWFILFAAATATLFWVSVQAPARLGRGRITRALRFLPPKVVFSPPWVRLSRYFLLAICAGPIEQLAGGIWLDADVVYWVGCIVLLLDDYLTGDDDRWRRFWEAVRNKVRWLMELPAPAEPTTA